MLLVDILLEWVFECTGTLVSFNHLMRGTQYATYPTGGWTWLTFAISNYWGHR